MYKRRIKVHQVKKNKIREISDIVLVEKPIDILVNSDPLVNIMCLPKDLKELATGFLYSSGLIDSINDIVGIGIDNINNKIEIQLEESKVISSEISALNPLGRIIDSTHGISSSWKDIIKRILETDNSSPIANNKMVLKAEVISQFINRMQSETKLFKKTGGCHGCAIFSKDQQLLTLMEDVGRHNAIDKAIGKVLLKGESFENVILCSTGRLTGDSVLKAVRAKIPIVASVSAPIESGIRLALVYGTTLIGFVRENRMNIYTHPFRIDI